MALNNEYPNCLQLFCMQTLWNVRCACEISDIKVKILLNLLHKITNQQMKIESYVEWEKECVCASVRLCVDMCANLCCLHISIVARLPS